MKLQKRSTRGFDCYENVLDKLIEEAQELTEAVAKGNSSDIEEEYGDLLFTFVEFGSTFEY